MKKKIVSVLLVAAMAVSMFTGCGSKSDSKKSDSKSGEKTLEVWVPPLDDATEKNWGDLLKDWEKENDCKVNLTVIPWDKYEETYTTALNSGEGPDVGYMYNEMFPTYIDAGAVEDMSSYVTDEDKKEYIYNYVVIQRRQENNLNEKGLTYNEFVADCGGLETETSHYTSPSGDKLVITCAYGYN